MLVLGNFVIFALIATGFALHAATWSRLVAGGLLLVFAIIFLLVPWVRAGFVGAGSLYELLNETPERTVWLAIHQVPNKQTHLQIHDEDRHSWRLRLPPEEAEELIDAWTKIVPGIQVSMASTEREVEWFHDPKAPRGWPRALPPELLDSGFVQPPK